MTTANVQENLQIAIATKATFSSTLRDTKVIMIRNIKRVLRTPRLLIFSSIQPIMFFVLFRYVFAGPLQTSGHYVDFLLPGIFVQASLFGGTTAIALSSDLASGMVDRFKSLPIARVAVLAGRTLADSARNVVTLTLLTIVGIIFGFRFHAGFLSILAGYAMLLLFAHAFSWLSAFIGISAKDPETAQIMSFLPLFPFIFASTIFQPSSNFPTWLQGFAEHQPISVTATTVRALVQGGPVWATGWQALMWAGIFLIVFIPLTVSKYRKQ